MFEHEPAERVFKHLSRDPANVNARKNMFDPYMQVYIIIAQIYVSVCFALGSSPERRDIRQYTDICDSTSLLVEDLQLNSGTPLFISVIGKPTVQPSLYVL